MKAYDFVHWHLNKHNEGLLFFAQCLEEMLFHYGHDSLKVPALNFHYLCVEIDQTIKKVENEVVDKGNIKPLFEELSDTFGKDPIAGSLYGKDFNSLFYTKNVDGEYNRICNDIY